MLYLWWDGHEFHIFSECFYFFGYHLVKLFVYLIFKFLLVYCLFFSILLIIARLLWFKQISILIYCLVFILIIVQFLFYLLMIQTEIVILCTFGNEILFQAFDFILIHFSILFMLPYDNFHLFHLFFLFYTFSIHSYDSLIERSSQLLSLIIIRAIDGTIFNETLDWSFIFIFPKFNIFHTNF